MTDMSIVSFSLVSHFKLSLPPLICTGSFSALSPTNSYHWSALLAFLLLNVCLSHRPCSSLLSHPCSSSRAVLSSPPMSSLLVRCLIVSHHLPRTRSPPSVNCLCL
ncbi:hypothetical protein CLOM_g3364 [Closterium sp. NIES-68]|nr:hypothetical protein CLOM_g3364 [Closterium sp. NIES-68]GJP84305.1 hypothetical protein CLOP_g14366 [Closterium sp. NIES-67]